MCEDGSLGDNPSDNDPTEPPDNDPADPSGDDPAEPINDRPADDAPGDDNAGAGPVPTHPADGADPEALRRLRIVEHQDPHLDADLTAWHDAGAPARRR